MTAKARLHQLIEELPEEQVAAVERFLADPVLRAVLLAPEDDEPESPEERAAVAEARARLAAGERPVPQADAERFMFDNNPDD